MTDSATYPVVLPGFPIELFLEARQHNESLMREFTFIVEAESDPTEHPGPACSRSSTSSATGSTG